MRRIFSIILVLLLAIRLLNGQIYHPFNKGNSFLGGSLSFNYQKSTSIPELSSLPTKYNNSYTLQYDIRAGCFVIKNLGIGISTNLIYNRWKQYFSNNSQVSRGKYYYLYVGPMVRYYTKYNLYVEGLSLIGFSNESLDLKDFKNGNEYLFGLGLGYSMFITKSVAIEPEIIYVHSSEPHERDISKYFMNSIKVELGLQIYLEKKSKIKNIEP